MSAARRHPLEVWSMQAYRGWRGAQQAIERGETGPVPQPYRVSCPTCDLRHKFTLLHQNPTLVSLGTRRRQAHLLVSQASWIQVSSNLYTRQPPDHPGGCWHRHSQLASVCTRGTGGRSESKERKITAGQPHGKQQVVLDLVLATAVLPETLAGIKVFPC